jgi:hypothetical protein
MFNFNFSRFIIFTIFWFSCDPNILEITIPAKAFDFGKSSDIQLLIQLNNNLLNETSFEFGIFNATKRMVSVILINNN